MTELQEFADAFYMRHGPCCAGCDWWRAISSMVGDCTRNAPVSAEERGAMLGIEPTPGSGIRAGHVVTRREHHCGDFKDDFDWTSLPLPYRVRIKDRSLVGRRPGR